MTQGADPADRPAFEGGTAFLLARVGAAARRDWARMLTERDLTPHHHGVLMTLAEFGPTGQQQLSDAIGVDPRNAVPVVEALVERTLVVRDVDPADRRRRVLTLTADGRDLADELRTTGLILEQRFLGALSPADQRHLRRMLATLLADQQAEPERPT